MTPVIRKQCYKLLPLVINHRSFYDQLARH